MKIVALTALSSLTFLSVPALPANANVYGAIDPLHHATLLAAAKSKVVLTTPLRLAPSKLPPIAFVPSAIVDPQTGKPVSRTTMIVAPSGKRVTAGDYWDAVNALEKEVNARGQSVLKGGRVDLGVVVGGDQAALVAGSHKIALIGSATFASGVPAASAIRALAPSASEALTPSDSYKSFVQNPSVLVKPSPTPAGVLSAKAAHEPSSSVAGNIQTLFHQDPATLPYGYKSLFNDRTPATLPPSEDAAPFFEKTYPVISDTPENPPLATFDAFVSSFAETTKSDGPGIHVQATVQGSLFGSGFDVAQIDALESQSSANLQISAADQNVFSGSIQLPITKQWSAQFDSQVVSVPLDGNLTLRLTGEVTGIVGVSAMISGGSTLTSSVVGTLNLAGDYHADLSAGDDIFSAKLSVQGDVTFADITLPLVATAGFVNKAFRSGVSGSVRTIYACRPHFVYGISGDIVYTLFKGSVQAQVDACVKLCATVLTTTIAQWDGITGSGKIFSRSGDVAIGPVYTDLPQYGIPISAFPVKVSGSVVFSKDDASGMPGACATYFKNLGEDPTAAT